MNRGILKSIGIIIGLIIVIISPGCKRAEQTDIMSSENIVQPDITPAQPVIPEEYQNATEIDLRKDIIEQILGLTDGVLSVADITEEFCFTDDNGVYRAILHGIDDTYYMSIHMNGVDVIEKLQYEYMEIEIISQNEGWTLNNPSSKDIEEYIYNTYLAEDETRATPIPLGENEIYILYLDDIRRETIMPVGTNRQSEISNSINYPAQTIVLEDYENTDEYYFSTDIRLVVPQDNSEPVEYELLINRYNDMVLKSRKAEKAIVDDELTDFIISFMHDTGWFYISLEQIKDISLAQMLYNGEKIAEIMDDETLKELEAMLFNAQCIGYTPKTINYGPYIELITSTGQFQIFIDWEDDLMMLGSSFHYDYGPGVTGTEPTDNYPKMLELFGLEELNREYYETKAQDNAIEPQLSDDEIISLFVDRIAYCKDNMPDEVEASRSWMPTQQYKLEHYTNNGMDDEYLSTAHYQSVDVSAQQFTEIIEMIEMNYMISSHYPALVLSDDDIINSDLYLFAHYNEPEMFLNMATDGQYIYLWSEFDGEYYTIKLSFADIVYEFLEILDSENGAFAFEDIADTEYISIFYVEEHNLKDYPENGQLTELNITDKETIQNIVEAVSNHSAPINTYPSRENWDMVFHTPDEDIYFKIKVPFDCDDEQYEGMLTEATFIIKGYYWYSCPQLYKILRGLEP